MLFAVGETVLIADSTVFAMDGAVSLQNSPPAACQPPPSLRFRCI